MATTRRTPPQPPAASHDGTAPTKLTRANARAEGAESDHPHNGLERQRVGDIQRARILAAMTEVACERGAANVTVAHVVARSGVSRRTFYELFEDREDCFLGALDEALARAAGRLHETWRPADSWRDRVRSALVALLEFFEDEPFAGRLLVVETLAGGPVALERRQRVLGELIAAVGEGSMEGKTGASGKGSAVSGKHAGASPRRTQADENGPPSLTAEGVVGAVLSVIHNRMLAHDSRQLLQLTNPLMAMIVLSYLGPAAARREQGRAMPESRKAEPVRSDPLTELHMRLTYRTVRVLLAISSNPGSSNRQVADAAGIGDPGQISKLLGRLGHLGLIQNTASGPTRGEANAWRLTDRGQQVERAISAQTARL